MKREVRIGETGISDDWKYGENFQKDKPGNLSYISIGITVKIKKKEHHASEYQVRIFYLLKRRFFWLNLEGLFS